MFKCIKKITDIFILTTAANILFSFFFKSDFHFLPLLLLFLVLNIICKINVFFEIGFFITGIIIFRFLCYGTFVFDYKEISMGVIFGRYSRNMHNIMFLILLAAFFILILKYKIKIAFKRNCIISIFFFVAVSIILYLIRPLIFNYIIQYQEYGSKIYMFNSLCFYYYFIFFLTAILIPVNLFSKMICLVKKKL